MLNFSPGFYYIFGMERTIKMSYGYPECRWIDVYGSKVKPISFRRDYLNYER
tara:strand:+ start:303 stop:458 length:156 start_codon:yes stop_codon:yes gene_type:complete